MYVWGVSVLPPPQMSYSFIQNCCWITHWFIDWLIHSFIHSFVLQKAVDRTQLYNKTLQVSHRQRWKTCVKYARKVKLIFRGRLKQFDGLIWLILTPIFYDRPIRRWHFVSVAERSGAQVYQSIVLKFWRWKFRKADPVILPLKHDLGTCTLQEKK